MENEIVIREVNTEVELTPEYKGMLEHINNVFPAIKKDSENFYKSDSQFKNITLDVTDITPISSIRHVLAVIEKTRLALEENGFKFKKQQIELKKKEKKLEETEDQLDKELLETEIQEIKAGLFNAENYAKGAIRKLSFFATQYQALVEKLGVSELTEEEVERNESKHHIMTAMKQALLSARTRGGVIDEGNHIYLFDLGINGAAAQAEVFNYLKLEGELLERGTEPTHEMTVMWLEACAEKFANSGSKFAESRGFIPLDKKSLAKELTNNSVEE